MKQLIPAVALLIVLGACGAPDESFEEVGAVDDSDVTTPEETTSTRLDVELVPAPTKPPPTTAPGTGDGPVFQPGDDPVAFAIADLAHRMSVPENDIEVVEQQEVMWRDGSLGCPQPGFLYTQALVDGSRIVLAIGDVTYDYHQGAGRAPFLCEEPGR